MDSRIAAVLVGGLCVLLAASAASSAAAAQPGARRDERGRFLNRAGEIPFASPLVTWPLFLRRALAMLTGREGVPERVANDGAFLRENARHSEPTVTWVGHATLLVQMEHASFLTDPIWSERAGPGNRIGPERMVGPGMAIGDLPPIDFVLVSHNHYDHLDLETLSELARRDARTRFYVPLDNGDTLRDEGIVNVVELDWGQEVEHGGVRIVCLPAQHWSRRGPFDARKALWASYAVLGAGRRFYFAGDTGYFDGFGAAAAEHGPFDLAALPIGAYDPPAMMRPWHMNPEEAVQAARDLGARQAVAIHFGTFDLSDEPPSEPPRRFLAAAAAAGLAPEATLVLRVGETRGF